LRKIFILFLLVSSLQCFSDLVFSEDTIQKEINTKNYKKEEITPLYGRLTVKISNIQRELTTKEKVGDLW
jgi:hypothetical protein